MVELVNQTVRVTGPGGRLATLQNREQPLGLDIRSVDVRVTVRKSVTVGEVLMFDLAQSDGAVSNATLFDAASAWRNVIAPTAQGIAAGYPLCVSLEVIADNATGSVRVKGIVAADLAGTNVIGDQLAVTSAGTLARALSGVGERVVAWALVAGATEQSVYFDGLGGFGAVQNPLPVGLQVPNVDILCTNRTGTTMVVGDVVMLDMIQTDAGTSNATLGDAASCWANILVPTTAAIVAGLPLCVALEATVNDAVGSFRIEGIVDAKMNDTNVLGDDLVGMNALLELDRVVAATEVVYAIALEAGAAAVRLCWFKGVGGFGDAA